MCSFWSNYETYDLQPVQILCFVVICFLFELCWSFLLISSWLMSGSNLRFSICRPQLESASQKISLEQCSPCNFDWHYQQYSSSFSYHTLAWHVTHDCYDCFVSWVDCYCFCLLQEAAVQGNLIAICLEQLNDQHPLLRQWLALCLGKVHDMSYHLLLYDSFLDITCCIHW